MFRGPVGVLGGVSGAVLAGPVVPVLGGVGTGLLGLAFAAPRDVGVAGLVEVLPPVVAADDLLAGLDVARGAVPARLGCWLWWGLLRRWSGLGVGGIGVRSGRVLAVLRLLGVRIGRKSAIFMGTTILSCC